MPPILMLHGMWSRPSTFQQLRAELASVGVTSAAPTLPMHDVPPGSPAPPGIGSLGVGDYVDYLVGEVATLGERPVILGHSMGGLLAQKLAERVPVAGLILLATAPSASANSLSLASLRTMAGVTSQWGWWKRPTLLSAGAARWGVMNGVSAEETEVAIAELTWDSGRVLRQIAFPWADREGAARVAYARLAVPALVLVGCDDRIVPPATSRKTARLLGAAGARVDYEEWPGVGHWLFHDAVRPRLAGAITRFMAGLPPLPADQ